GSSILPAPTSMIIPIKETWTSVRNLEYGQQIIKKTVGQTVRYWMQYVLAISALLLILALSVVVYFTPQVPKLVERIVPQMTIEVIDGKLSTDLHQPFVIQEPNFKFVLNTQGQAQEIDQIESGILVLEDQLTFKNQGQTQIFKFSDIGQDLKLEKQAVISWLTGHKSTLLGIGLALIAVASFTFLGSYLIFKGLAFLVAAGILLLIGKIISRKVTYADTIKLTLYAAVPALVGGLISPQVALIVGSFFAVAWLVKLPYNKR
ncbi:MAG: DUF1189 family protein, partial [bacterium]|nr:DUF1189 family protein [bacterium]